MADRNFSPEIMFQRMAADHKPLFRFTGQSPEQFERWKREALPRVLATLGDWPARVPLNPELIAEWQHDGLRKQRWLIDVGPHISAALLVNIPPDLRNGERRAALLCCHGHGKFGKEAVMGNDSSPELRASIASCNYSYGHQMANAGFVTFAIDWIGFGERNDANKPNHHNQAGGRDWCNLYYLHATMLGLTSLSINVTHGRAATDFAASLPFVDPGKLGVMGLSGGGTMTLWMALCDERFKAAEIICYSDLWAVFGMRDTNYCGMQVAPGLYKLVDLPDAQGLIAPRPLLVDIGVYDTCFTLDSSMACYRQVDKIYHVAGVPDRLELDLHPGEHGWGGNKSVAFFNKWL
ncbi:MAG: alpha/beta hydrolase family protein [Phycisphaerae bacterium]|nr:alpha/beta hydrolase family protein [Phycisphaerae bacterium]